MNILVCITHVPDTTSRIAFTNDNTEFDKTGFNSLLALTMTTRWQELLS